MKKPTKEEIYTQWMNFAADAFIVIFVVIVVMVVFE